MRYASADAKPAAPVVHASVSNSFFKATNQPATARCCRRSSKHLHTVLAKFDFRQSRDGNMSLVPLFIHLQGSGLGKKHWKVPHKNEISCRWSCWQGQVGSQLKCVRSQQSSATNQPSFSYQSAPASALCTARHSGIPPNHAQLHCRANGGQAVATGWSINFASALCWLSEARSMQRCLPCVAEHASSWKGELGKNMSEPSLLLHATSCCFVSAALSIVPAVSADWPAPSLGI